MDTLLDYLHALNNSKYDHRDTPLINKELQAVTQKLFDEGKTEELHFSELDRQVFSVQKSFGIKSDPEKGTLNGLGWNMTGTQQKEDGSVIPIHWPDVTSFKKEDFEYFEKRYQESKNLFVRTEYGLMVYFGNITPFSKHNDFKTQLSQELFDLATHYLEKSKKGGDRNHFALDFLHTIELAFGIAEKSKIEPQLSNIIKCIFQVHQDWDIKTSATQRILLDLSGLMSDNFALFNKLIDFKKVIEKNMIVGKELEKTYLWGAVYAVDKNLTIEQKLGKPSNEQLLYKAALYEKLSMEADRQNNAACVNFSEKALRLYEQLKDEPNIKRLENAYSQLRGKFALSEIRKGLPQEYLEATLAMVHKTVAETDSNGLLEYFIATPWYSNIATIKARAVAVRSHTVLLSTMPTSIVDKYGNTTDTFFTEAEKEQLNFWNSFSYSYQLGTQIMHAFFMESFQSGKLNYDTVSKFLEATWYGEPITRHYHGCQVQVRPIDTLTPGLKRIFEELDLLKKNGQHPFDCVTIVDSLTVKIEGLLRFICEKIGIATFKTRNKGSEKLVMEKLIDDLLADLEHRHGQETNFDEEDRILLKYIMTEKAGLNLRNVVAHGLLDIDEYGFELVLVLFCLIIKLTKYKFEQSIPPKNEDESK